MSLRNAPAAVKTWLAANDVTHRADLITLTLSDGSTVYRWTTCDRPLVVGGNTYLAAAAGAAPLVQPGVMSLSSKLVVDTRDMTLIGNGWTVGGLALGALAAQGYFDGARIQIDHLIMPTPGDVSLGPIPSFFEGRVAGVDPKGPALALRLKSESEALNELLPRFLVGPSCGNVVYDANCGLSKAAFTLAGTVSTPGTASIGTATAGITAKATGYFNLGLLVFTSGALSGVRRAVRDWTSPTLSFYVPLPSAPAAGDAFTIYPGCPRTRGACLTTFNNLAQYRGFPHAPSNTAGGGR